MFQKIGEPLTNFIGFQSFYHESELIFSVAQRIRILLQSFKIIKTVTGHKDGDQIRFITSVPPLSLPIYYWENNVGQICRLIFNQILDYLQTSRNLTINREKEEKKNMASISSEL